MYLNADIGINRSLMILHVIESGSEHCPWSCHRVDIRRRKMLRCVFISLNVPATT